MSLSANDGAFMAEALQLAARGLYTTEPNPRVGCVIVRDNEIVGRGFHAFAGGPHAEIEALQEAGERASGATVYVTLEPCAHHGKTPPCVEALLRAKVARVVAAMVDPNPLVGGKGLAQLAAAGIATESGLMAAEAAALNPGFISRMTRQRPWVRVKLAASLDGRTAMASGESQWITGEAARADVHRLRARSSAILTGIGTVLKDDPQLTVRLSSQDLGIDVDMPQPIRIVLDRQGQIAANARLFSDETSPVWVVTAQTAVASLREKLPKHVRLQVIPEREGHLDLAALWTWLAEEEINEVMVESGPKLAGALLEGGWIDECVIYLAPCLMGVDARGLFDLSIGLMAERRPVQINDIRRVGTDWRLRCSFPSAHIV